MYKHTAGWCNGNAIAFQTDPDNANLTFVPAAIPTEVNFNIVI